MKKLIITLAAIALAVGAQASCCAWKYSCATKADEMNGASVYVVLGTYTSAPTYASIDALKDVAYGDPVLTTTKLAPKFSNGATGTIDSEKLTAASPNFYLVLVSADEKSFSVGAVQDATSMLYEPGSAQTGTLSFAPTSMTFANFSGTPEPTPEPTSGLLVILGMAGLALKRKRA